MKILKQYIKAVNEYLDSNSGEINEKLKDINMRLEKYESKLTIEELKLKEEGSDYEYIKNYYRYFIGVERTKKLYPKELRDFDCYLGVIDQLKKDNEDIKFNGGRYFIINGIVWETDTAYSFKTIFHDFLRKNYYDDFTKYMEKYNLEKPNEIYKSIYLLRHFDEIAEKANKDLIKKFNEFARLYHTYNNVIFVPYGYNCKRNRKFSDIYSLSMKHLIRIGVDKTLIEKYCRYHEDKEMYDFDRKLKPKLSPNYKKEIIKEEEYLKYLDNAINFINKNY